MLSFNVFIVFPQFTLINAGGEDPIILLCWRIAFSPQPNIQRPVCKLKFVICYPAEKTRQLYLSWINRVGPTEFKNTFFQKAKLRFLIFFAIFDKIHEFSKSSLRRSLTLPPMGYRILWLQWQWEASKAPPKKSRKESFLTPCCYITFVTW